MERTAVNAKEEDTVLVVATADAAVIATDVENPIVVSDEIVSPIKVNKEMIMTTNDVEHVVVSKLAVVTNETAFTVNATSKNLGGEEDQLNLAMASTKISTNEVDEIKHNLGEKVLDEQQKLETGTVEKDIVINEKSDINLDSSVKIQSESDEINNSTIGCVFEDVVEYLINVEGVHVVKEHFQDVIQEENVPDNESSPQQGVEESEGDEDPSEKTKDPAAPAAPAEPVVPVPVDDDTNDPQYIPRSGRFYEHDDRMAYSATSSEGSESVKIYEVDSEDDDGFIDGRRIRTYRHYTGTKKQKSVTPIYTAENTDLAVWDRTLSSKKVLAISKVAATIKNSETSVNADELGKKFSVGSRKSRDIDVLDKWTHDMYDENKQTRKRRDELLAHYGYDIREELEAPRARRHHKYGRGATSKYTRNWQDTKDYTGAAGSQQSMKPGVMARLNVGGPNKNIKKSTTDEYTSELPTLEDTKKSEPTVSNESPAVVEISDQNYEQRPKVLFVQNEDKKSVDSVVETNEAQHHTSPSRETSKYYTTHPTNRNNRHDQQNGGPPSSLSSTNINNYFKRPPLKTPISKKKGTPVNRDSPSTSANLNFFKRRPQQNSGGHNQHHNNKQQHLNNGQGGQGHNQQHQNSSPSVSRDRNFHQNHTSQQYNRGRYFFKRSTPLSSSSSNQHNYDQQYHSATPTTAGTESTKHDGGGHYQNYNNRQHKYKNQKVELPPLPTMVVRSSKRYSVPTRRELPDTILNVGGISKALQPQPPALQQQNSLVMENQKMQPVPQELLQQQPPPSLQTQQFHQPLQKIHHGMVLDHNTGMKVINTADPSMYHHRSAKNQNAAIYQPVPTGATGVTSLSSGTQSLQQQETFVTTTYQQQQLSQQQLPPKSVNLTMPIVAPASDSNQQQGI